MLKNHEGCCGSPLMPPRGGRGRRDRSFIAKLMEQPRKHAQRIGARPEKCPDDESPQDPSGTDLSLFQRKAPHNRWCTLESERIYETVHLCDNLG